MRGPALAHRLSIRCASCRGLCCTLLCFSRSEGFPADKEAGRPCPHLEKGFRCAIHGELARRGLRGCLAFECFGAGPAVCALFPPEAESAALMDAFRAARQLCQSLWYLSQAEGYGQGGEPLSTLIADGLELLSSREGLTGPGPDGHHLRTSALLHRLHRQWYPRAEGRKQYLGADLRRTPLENRDLSGALLIAADLRGRSLRGSSLLGADLRDTRLEGADLSRCRFLTQFQVNSALGDHHTALPPGFNRPPAWT